MDSPSKLKNNFNLPTQKIIPCSGELIQTVLGSVTGMDVVLDPDGSL